MADDPEFHKSLTANIKDVLGHLSENEASDVSKYLRSKGVRKLPDLKHITVNILNEKLNFIESSELFTTWQDSYGTRQPDNEPSASKSTTRRPLSTVRDNARAALQTDLPVFNEDSPYFPSGVKKAIRAEKRPTRSDRENMCERIVDHCRKVVPNLERSRLNDVAKQRVGHFPKSFKDTILISEHGSDSLALQLRTKFDNNDRKLKRPKAPLEVEAPGTKEAYGCVLWEAPLPAGTTEESLENIRLDMKKTYRVSRKDWDWRVIKKQLKDSYYLQRKHINATAIETQKKGKTKKRKVDEENDLDADGTDESVPPSVSVPDIKSNWPFLFTYQGINIHFKILTNVDLKTKISDFVASEAERLIDFLARKSEELGKLKRNMVRAEKLGLGSTKLVAAITMLILYFKEDLKYLVKFTEKTATYEEMRTFQDLPPEKTPILVAAGDSLYNFDKLFVYIDNLLVSSVRNIVDGLVMLFGAHFIFNICYAEQLVSFFTYLQKGIVGISPAAGSKCRLSTSNRRANERAVKLQNNLVALKEQEAEEANEPL